MLNAITTFEFHANQAELAAKAPTLTREERMVKANEAFREKAAQNRIARRAVEDAQRVQQANFVGGHFADMMKVVMPELCEFAQLSEDKVIDELNKFTQTLVTLAKIRVGDLHFGPLLDMVEIVICDMTNETACFDEVFNLTRDMMRQYITPVVEAKDNVEMLIVLSNLKPGSISSEELQPAYQNIMTVLENDIYLGGKITKQRVAEMAAEFQATGRVELNKAARNVTEAQAGVSQQ